MVAALIETPGVKNGNGAETRKRKKRANGEGYIFRCGRRWGGQVWAFCPNKGKKRLMSFTGSTRAEVAEKIAVARQVHDYMAAKTVTVAEWFELWMTRYMIDIRTSTRDTYRRTIHGHIVPHLGAQNLNRLTPDLVSTALSRMGETLCPKSLQLVHAILSKGFRQAVVSGYAWRNVMQAVSKPRTEAKDHQVFTREELVRFLEAAKTSRFDLFFLLVASCGLRRGEGLGVSWSDISFERGELTIRRNIVKTSQGIEVNPPKTKASRRTIHLPPYVMDELKKVNARYRRGFVTKTASGEPVCPDRVSAEFKKLCRLFDLPNLKLHELRHTHASLMLSSGVPVSDVQRRLGHNDSRTTLDTYSHAIPGDGDRAAEIMDRIMRGEE
ncbi:MAG TPA: site-specific integrase [Candidatus Ozemobacteraceae bacterium]|nr:site-specific integrase [Candidatus Ozemobacteraceae bacterium]